MDIIETSAGTGTLRTIGLHITLPGLSCWPVDGVECLMLHRILNGALYRRSLLSEPFILAAFQRKVFGLGTTDNPTLALSTIAQQLDAIGMISGAHLAWCDPEYGWQTDRPKPEPCPFQNHIEDFNVWSANRQPGTLEQAQNLLSSVTEFVEKLKNNPPLPLQEPPLA
jgi:hypothetical protein